MLAETSGASGTGQCPSCGQQFVIAAEPQPLPVVRAQVVPTSPPPPVVVSPHARPPGSAPRTAAQAYRRVAPAAYPRTRDTREARDKYLIGSLIGGGALLICGMIWILQHGSPTVQEPPPPPTTVASSKPKVKDAEIERLEAKQKELEKEVERNKEIRDAQEKAQLEAIRAERLRQDTEMAATRSKLRRYYANRLFEGDEKAADAFITELENVRNEFGLLPENAKERESAAEYDKFIVGRMIQYMEKNPVLAAWLEEHGKKPGDVLPGLAQKNPNSADGSSPGPSFDFGKYASFGSGFWISGNGWLLTNHHVVNPAKSVDLRLRDGTIVQAKVVKTDSVNDLALLKAETTPPVWLPVSKGEFELKLGQTVFTIGYPNAQVQGLEPKFTDGRISSVTGIGDSKNSYQTTVPIQHGNSGGPLVDLLTGWVVGVINSRLEDMRSGTGIANVSYAIKGKEAWALLESVPEARAAVQAKPAAALKKGDERAVIDRVKDAAILILKLR